MNFFKLWIVDDDELFSMSCSEYFRGGQYEVSRMSCGQEVLDRLDQGYHPDLVLLDYRLPDVNGIDICRELVTHRPAVKVIFITAYGSYDRALDAMDIGAFAYMIKPVDLAQVERVLLRASQALKRDGGQTSNSSVPCEYGGQLDLVGDSPGIVRVKATMELAAPSHAPILLTGETGTGKSLVARLVHLRSGRKGRLVALNCASLPENLVESELFGYVKGAFTGATSDKKGLMEMADGGTLLLDEITEMPLHVQAKLLTAIDEGVIRRVGDVVTRPLDVRIIAASNVPFEEMRTSSRFRQDLFFRLSVIHMHLPPLRARSEDIPGLVSHLLRNLEGGAPRRLAPGEMNMLKEHAWPGNIRELKNLLHRTLVLTPQGDLRPSSHIAPTDSVEEQSEGMSDFLGHVQPLDQYVRRYATKVFVATGENYSRSARMLKISTGRLRRILAGKSSATVHGRLGRKNAARASKSKST